MAEDYPNSIIWHATAGEDLTGFRGYGVTLNGSGQAVKTGVSGASLVGILLNDPANGGRAEIGLVGVFPVISIAAIAALDALKINSGGKTGTSTLAADRVFGKALTAAAGADVLFWAFVGCGISTSRG